MYYDNDTSLETVTIAGILLVIILFLAITLSLRKMEIMAM